MDVIIVILNIQLFQRTKKLCAFDHIRGATIDTLSENYRIQSNNQMTILQYIDISDSDSYTETRDRFDDTRDFACTSLLLLLMTAYSTIIRDDITLMM